MSDQLKQISVLFVEDEDRLRSSMASVMGEVFAKVYLASNGDEGLKKFQKYHPDIVITDISMPIMDGMAMIKRIKEISANTPVVILSAFSEKEKLLKAIELGVEKYIIKPIDMDEFFEALGYLASEKITATSTIKIGQNIIFDRAKRTLIRGGEEILLTKKELAFMMILIKRLGSLVLHEEIKNGVWVGGKVSDAAVRTFIKRVRDKLGDDIIKNIPGVGYRLVP